MKIKAMVMPKTLLVKKLEKEGWTLGEDGDYKNQQWRAKWRMF